MYLAEVLADIHKEAVLSFLYTICCDCPAKRLKEKIKMQALAEIPELAIMVFVFSKLYICSLHYRL